MPGGHARSNHQTHLCLKRLLLPSTVFIRSARRFARKHPQTALELEPVLVLLAEDAFHPQLKTHKLKGKLIGSWACSAGSAGGYLAMVQAMFGLSGLTSSRRSLGRITRSMSSIGIAPSKT